jgi:hypothetical protein
VKGKENTLKSVSGFGAHHDNIHFTVETDKKENTKVGGQSNNTKGGIEDRVRIRKRKRGERNNKKEEKRREE